MIDRPEAKRSNNDRFGGAETTEGRGVEGRSRETPTFNPKGIGSNAFLVAAAALVPFVIIGMAGLKTIMSAKTSKR